MGEAAVVLVPEVVAEEEVVAAEAEEAVVEGTHQSPLMIFFVKSQLLIYVCYQYLG